MPERKNFLICSKANQKVGRNRFHLLVPMKVNISLDKDLELAPFAKTFATRPEHPLQNEHCFYCMTYKKNISMKSRGSIKKTIQETSAIESRSTLLRPVSPHEGMWFRWPHFVRVKVRSGERVFHAFGCTWLWPQAAFLLRRSRKEAGYIRTERARVWIQIEFFMILSKRGGQLCTLE